MVASNEINDIKLTFKVELEYLESKFGMFKIILTSNEINDIKFSVKVELE